MKKVIKTGFALVLMAIAVTTANAQEKKLNFIIKAGVDISTLTGDVTNTKMKVGAIGGIGVDYNLSESLYLNTGLNYVMKGTNTKTSDINTKLDYLVMPMHIGYKMPIDDSKLIKFHAGPYIGYAVNGKEKFYTQNWDLFASPERAERFDAGLGFGVGAEMGVIDIDLACDFGLTNVNKSSTNAKMRNMSAFLTLGYRF